MKRSASYYSHSGEQASAAAEKSAGTLLTDPFSSSLIMQLQWGTAVQLRTSYISVLPSTHIH